MSSTIWVAYATSYGSTQEVAEAVAATLREAGLPVDLRLLREVRDLSGCRALVMGAPLIMFHWHKDAMQFVARHKDALQRLPVAVFALGPVHDPHDEQEWQDSHAQLAKELARYPWFHPIVVEMFGGKYDPEKLRFPLKQMAGKEPPSDLRDWDAIRAWAAGLAGMLGG
jgi:menaquinone-dependent protoporphyrinogen oxidase